MRIGGSSGGARAMQSPPPPSPSTSSRRDDPSRATRSELTSRATESVNLVGALARLVGKAASSPALQSTVASFAEYETTIDSTSEMLKKCQRGLADLDELLDGMSEASTRAARPGG